MQASLELDLHGKHVKWYLQENRLVFGDAVSLFEKFAQLDSAALQLEFIAQL